jgi:hypothetical protein
MDELLYEVGLYYDIVVRSSGISGGQMERRDSQLIAVVPGEVSTMSKKIVFWGHYKREAFQLARSRLSDKWPER